MEGSYLFEFERNGSMAIATVELDDDNRAKHKQVEIVEINNYYRNIIGKTPHAYLLANTECGDRVELAYVVGFDFSSCSDEDIDRFLTALINKLDNDMIHQINSITDFVAYIKANSPY